MKRAGSLPGLAAGLALLVIGNTLILGLAAWNRSGGPRSEILLTERELALPLFRQDENTRLFLSLALANEIPRIARHPAFEKMRGIRGPGLDWLDREKLHQLGFGVDVEPEDPEAVGYYSGAGTRRAFLALEMEGEAWKQWIESLAADDPALAFEKMTRSRLFAIDADTDAEALRLKIAGRPGCVVVQCVIGLRLVEKDGQPCRLAGELEDLSAREIFVPSVSRSSLEPFLAKQSWEEARREAASSKETASPAPRYRAAVAFGRNDGPWLARVEPMP